MTKSKFKKEKLETTGRLLETGDGLRLLIEPPKLSRWVDKNANVLLLNMEVHLNHNAKFRFDLDVIFNPIPIPVNFIVNEDYYIGCTGAELVFQLKNGVIEAFSEGTVLNVNYKNTNGTNKGSSKKIDPELEVNGISGRVGSINNDKEKYSDLSANYTSEENTLKPVLLDKKTLRWQISMPRNLKVFEDYLIGNKNFSATCESISSKLEGTIHLKPSRIIYFDPNKSPLSLKQSMFMGVIMKMGGTNIENTRGIKIKFIQQE